MKILLYTSIVICAMLPFSIDAEDMQQGAAGNRLTPEQQVIAREQDYTNGLLRGDISLLKTVFAPSFVDTGSDGRLRTRDEMLKLIAGQPSLPSKIVETNRRVSIYGSTAIVTVEFELSGTFDNRPRVFHGRATDIWVRDGSTWRCVAAQSTEIH